jgi:hypothetical protein
MAPVRAHLSPGYLSREGFSAEHFARTSASARTPEKLLSWAPFPRELTRTECFCSAEPQLLRASRGLLNIVNSAAKEAEISTAEHRMGHQNLWGRKNLPQKFQMFKKELIFG